MGPGYRRFLAKMRTEMRDRDVTPRTAKTGLSALTVGAAGTRAQRATLKKGYVNLHGNYYNRG